MTGLLTDGNPSLKRLALPVPRGERSCQKGRLFAIDPSQPVPADPPKDVQLARGVQYLRMSTDHQMCSLDVQREAIGRYARDQGIDIVRTFADEGCSGLTLDGRPALRELLTLVADGKADFQAVLVYDVSRWGRFQDCDESAHYEYLCRRGGVRVEYCTEPFRNDGAPMSTVMKGLKRVMAGEYSRDLSRKVFAAKCWFARQGYFQGAGAGYGLRRMIVGANGRPSMVLQDGEYKGVQGARVVLVPGPEDEQQVVRWIFEQVANHGRGIKWVTEAIKARGLSAPRNRPWTQCQVAAMLSNEKYVGTLVFNRKTMKLKTAPRLNPPEQWIRVENAHPAIVDAGLFDRAQIALGRLASRTSNQRALAGLKRLLEKRGTLNQRLIDRDASVPCAHFFTTRFGSLTRAYALIGYCPQRDYTYLRGYGGRRRQVRAFRNRVAELLAQRGAKFEWESSLVLRVGSIRLAAYLAYAAQYPRGPQWTVQIHIAPLPDWALVERLDEGGTTTLDFWLVPANRGSVRLKCVYRKPLDRRVSAELDPLVDMVAAGLPSNQAPSCAAARAIASGVRVLT